MAATSSTSAMIHHGISLGIPDGATNKRWSSNIDDYVFIERLSRRMVAHPFLGPFYGSNGTVFRCV
jgi:hypothetical protein